MRVLWQNCVNNNTYKTERRAIVRSSQFSLGVPPPMIVLENLMELNV